MVLENTRLGQKIENFIVTLSLLRVVKTKFIVKKIKLSETIYLYIL